MKRNNGNVYLVYHIHARLAEFCQTALND